MDSLGPLPKSLSSNEPPPPPEDPLKKSGFGYGCANRLDEQLMKLRREMVGLRQLDMSLLSQLDALRKMIRDCRRALEEEEEETTSESSV